MKLCILLTPSMPPKPEAVKILHNWGNTMVVYKEGTTPKTIFGDHVMVEGTDEDLSLWLESAKQVWVGEGSPFLEHFNLRTFTPANEEA